MRAIFGVVSLLVALAIVGLLASRQLKATSQAIGTALPPVAGESAPVLTGTVREQSQQLQQKVQADVMKALEVGAAARKDDADK